MLLQDRGNQSLNSKIPAKFQQEEDGKENYQAAGYDYIFSRSIEFRKETIYFLLVDRFHEGDPTKYANLNEEYYDKDRQHWCKYWGGDLQGIIDKLDYLENLGVTAIWISPLFEQVEGMWCNMTALHGYWPRDFKRLNPRFLNKGDSTSLDEYTVFDRLIAEMHDRGMKLILDIVCNHSSPDINGRKGELYDDGVKIADFHNDVNNWYHHNETITDWHDEWQQLYCEISGLATFNEENPDYRNYIKSAIKKWLDQGVDALRIDTVKHMPLWFWQEFIGDIWGHKPSLFIFGEVGLPCHPWDGKSANLANKSGMSILDYCLCGSIRAALGQNARGGFHLIHNVFEGDYHYNTATELITFIDNHDIPRFQSINPDPEILRLAVILIMTCRGIPCITYGTEQYLHNDTDGGGEPYNRPMMEKWDRSTRLYQDLRLLSKLRRLNPAVSLGSHVEKYITSDVYCYLRRYRDSRCLVAMNKTEHRATFSVENTELKDGEYNCLITDRKLAVKDGKIWGLELEPKQAIVLSYIGKPVIGKTIVQAQLNGMATEMGETVAVTGDCPELGNWDITKAYRLEYINLNTWFGEIPFYESAGKTISYKYVLLRDNSTPRRENMVNRRWILAEQGTVKWYDNWAY